MAVEIDGSTVGEAALRRSRVDEVGMEIDGKEVEAVLRSVNGCEDNGASGFHRSGSESTVKGRG